MRSVIVPLKEPARRNLQARDPIETESSKENLSAGPKDPSNQAAETQLERSKKRLDRHIQRRQFALAQHRMEYVNLDGSKERTQESLGMEDMFNSIQHRTHQTVEVSSADKLVLEQHKMQIAMENMGLGDLKAVTLRSMQMRSRDRLKVALNQRQKESRVENHR